MRLKVHTPFQQQTNCVNRGKEIVKPTKKYTKRRETNGKN